MTSVQRAMPWLVAVAALVLAFTAWQAPPAVFTPDREVLFQVSTIDALMIGDYTGSATFATLAESGDFGLGTFDALDGEMVALNGTFWQATADGQVHRADPSMTTPFAVVTWFDSDIVIPYEHSSDLDAIMAATDTRLISENYFYAVAISGTFDFVTVRSFPRQEPPYPPLAEAVANQFTYQDVTGTLVGFRSPAYVTGINVPGYHLHFISDDRTQGGHLLDCRMREGNGALDITPRMTLWLPETVSFIGADLTGDRTQDVAAVERK
ncbi:MAG: acetolactate decarboxylase [Methanomicrobiales archaeon]|nr:acetolactate decarboxylase [Methanomicrobiales archaeon]